MCCLKMPPPPRIFKSQMWNVCVAPPAAAGSSSDISIYSDFKRKPPVAEPSSLCRQRRLDNLRIQASRALERPKILKNGFCLNQIWTMNFKVSRWWTKCEWRLPPLDIKSKFSKLKISTTKILSEMEVAPRYMLLTWFTLLLTLS